MHSAAAHLSQDVEEEAGTGGGSLSGESRSLSPFRSLSLFPLSCWHPTGLLCSAYGIRAPFGNPFHLARGPRLSRWLLVIASCCFGSVRFGRRDTSPSLRYQKRGAKTTQLANITRNSASTKVFAKIKIIAYSIIRINIYINIFGCPSKAKTNIQWVPPDRWAIRRKTIDRVGKEEREREQKEPAVGFSLPALVLSNTPWFFVSRVLQLNKLQYYNPTNYSGTYAIQARCLGRFFWFLVTPSVFVLLHLLAFPFASGSPLKIKTKIKNSW